MKAVNLEKAAFRPFYKVLGEKYGGDKLWGDNYDIAFDAIPTKVRLEADDTRRGIFEAIDDAAVKIKDVPFEFEGPEYMVDDYMENMPSREEMESMQIKFYGKK